MVIVTHLVELLADWVCELGVEYVALLLRLRDFLLYARVLLGVLILEAEVLKLGLYLAESESVCDGGVYVECLAGNLVLLVYLHELKRAHVVQAVGNLYEDDTNVFAHGEQELLEVLGLLRCLHAEYSARYLREAAYDTGNLVAEQVSYVFYGVVRILDNVMEKCCAD